MEKEATDISLTQKMEQFTAMIAKVHCPVIVVSNEVGLGIVPADAETRRFRDLAGLLHQRVAAVAQAVYFITAGIAQQIKGTAHVSN